MMISEEKNSSALQRFHAYVVHSIVTRGAAIIRVEGTATSDELVIVQAVQVNAQASGHWPGLIICWAGIP